MISICSAAEIRTSRSGRGCVGLRVKCEMQCRINHVADVANATGLRPQGAPEVERFFISPSVVK